jgi:hypothetical protein
MENFMKILMQGIYLIRHIKTKKIYIGCSIDIYQRLKVHKYELKSNNHINKKLQKDYNDNKRLWFEVLMIVNERKKLLMYEQFYMEKYNSKNEKFGYN